MAKWEAESTGREIRDFWLGFARALIVIAEPVRGVSRGQLTFNAFPREFRQASNNLHQSSHKKVKEERIVSVASTKPLGMAADVGL